MCIRDRGDSKDEAHDLLRDLVEGADNVGGQLALLARDEDAAAEEQRDHDDLEHRRIKQRLDEVRRENALDGVDDVGVLRLIRRVLRHFQHTERALEDLSLIHI